MPGALGSVRVAGAGGQVPCSAAAVEALGWPSRHAPCSALVAGTFCSNLPFCRYAVYKDPAGWLSINPVNGTVDTTALLDRESPFVHNSVYKALFLAIDSGEWPQTLPRNTCMCSRVSADSCKVARGPGNAQPQTASVPGAGPRLHP